MKKPFPIFSFFAKFEVNVSTLFLLLLALISGRYKVLFIQYLLTFIHELFHCIGALIFKVEIEKISFLPFGFYVQMSNLYTKKWYQELIIVILGPLSFFCSIYLIKYLYIYDYISYIGYIEANHSNLFILCFNLLPIFPLDGHVITRLILEKFLPQKKVIKISGILSFIATLILIIYTISHPQLILIGYLLYSQIHYWMFLKRKYRNFLLSKSGKRIEGGECLHSLDDLYRPKYNMVIKNKKIYREDEFAIHLLTKK